MASENITSSCSRALCACLSVSEAKVPLRILDGHTQELCQNPRIPGLTTQQDVTILSRMYTAGVQLDGWSNAIVSVYP